MEAEIIKAQSNPLDVIRPRLEALAAQQGNSLYDLGMAREPHGRVLRITISREGGVTLDDCERFHRAVVDIAEPVDYDYLEVTSPGADRPLRNEADWLEAVGKDIELRFYKAIKQLGKKIIGRLVSATPEIVVLETAGGQVETERRMISSARYAVVIDDGGGRLP